MKKVVCIFLTILITLIPSAISLHAEETSAKDDMRAVWVSSVINLDYPSKKGLTVEEIKKEADTAINRAADLGMNAIILQVRPCADALYKSNIFPWSEYLTGTQGIAPANGFDPLAYWIEKAHAKGLELHAWINPFRITHTTSGITDVNKLSANNPARKNPSWVVKYNNALYFDPGLPECRELIINGIKEIINNYDVDGIHLDDYFYPGEVFADNSSYNKYGGGMDRNDWRRENVNKVIKGIQSAINDINPEIRFGVSPFAIWQNSSSSPLGSDTKGFESYKSIYSDSRKWVKEGWLDYVCPQIYWYIGFDIADYQKVLDWWIDVCENTSVDLYVGHSIYKEYEKQSNWQGETIRQLRLNNTKSEVKGSFFFRMEHLYGSLGDQIKYYYQNRQNEPVFLMDKLTIAQPSANTSLTGSTAGYTIFGTCVPNKTLYMNGTKVTNVSAEGFFSIYVPLVKGDNVFTFTQENQTSVTRIITLKEAQAAALETMSTPSVSGLFPSVDEYISAGDAITLKCTAPAGAKVTAVFNGQTYTLNDDYPNRNYGSDTSKIYSSTYSYKIIAGSGNTAEVSNLGTAVYTVVYKGQTYKQTSSGAVWQIGKDAPYYATVTAASAWLYPQASTNNGSAWQLINGQKDKVTAVTNGKWVRLSTGKWVEKQNVSISLEKSFVTNALSNGRYTAALYADTITWTASAFSNLDISFDGKILNVYFGMQTTEPKVELPPSGSAVFNSVTSGTQNGTPYCSFTVKDDVKIEGFFVNYSNGELRLNIKKRKSLVLGDKPLMGFTFVIDPGHGQSDTGARGPMGNLMAEKDINLINAKKLSDRLKKLGATVVMTRESDIYLQLYERTEKSRLINPDMFISMHANSVVETTDSTNIRGFTVWYRNAGSLPLAETFAKYLSGINPLTTRKQISYQSNLYVARPSWTPSVIIEASYMCNIDDYSWLINDAKQNELADGLADAIIKYYGGK